MGEREHPRIRAWGRIALLAVVVAGLLAGCGSSKKTGKLVGIQASVGLNDVLSGTISKMDFGGVVVVELKDGTRVNALWDKKLGTDFVGGMVLEIAPTEDPRYWRVVRVVSIPSPKAD